MHDIFISAPIDSRIYVGERNDDVLGQHRGLHLTPQPTERERHDGSTKIGMRADVAAPLVEGHCDFEPSVLAQ
jgi:hypothetical protein